MDQVYHQLQRDNIFFNYGSNNLLQRTGVRNRIKVMFVRDRITWLTGLKIFFHRHLRRLDMKFISGKLIFLERLRIESEKINFRTKGSKR